MNNTITLPGLEGVIITRSEMNAEGVYKLDVEMPVIPHTCPSCAQKTHKIHDYRTQPVRHLKIAERPTLLYYR